jgi:hypothetical protein
MIKKSAILLALAAFHLTPAVAVPVAAPAAAPATPPVNLAPDLVKDTATELAQLLFSRELVQTQVGGVLDVNLPKSMKSNTDFAIYEKEYPGLIKAVVASIKPAMLKAYDEKVPLLWFNMSQLYRDNFTPGEISQLHAFYASPVGVRFMATIRRNSNADNSLNAAIANGEVNAKVVATVKAETVNAIRRSNAQISPADKLAIFKFENSPVGRKLAQFGPKAQKTQLDWDFYFTESQIAEFARARTEAISDFTTKADAAKTPKAQSPAI